MKAIKTFTALLLAAAVAISAAGCGGSDKSDKQGAAAPAAAEQSTRPAVQYPSKGGLAALDERIRQGAAQELDMEFVQGYLGDWHGMAECYDCTGSYESNNGLQAEVIARISYDEAAGRLKPFVAMYLDGRNDYNFKITSAEEYQDSDYHYFDITGSFMKQPMAEGSLIEYDADYDSLYVLCETDDGSGNVLKLLCCLRRLDAKWDYDNDYPYLDKDGVRYYKGMTLEERAKILQIDLSDADAQ